MIDFESTHHEIYAPERGVILSIWNIWAAITVENVSLIYSMNHLGGYLFEIKPFTYGSVQKKHFILTNQELK